MAVPPPGVPMPSPNQPAMYPQGSVPGATSQTSPGSNPAAAFQSPQEAAQSLLNPDLSAREQLKSILYLYKELGLIMAKEDELELEAGRLGPQLTNIVQSIASVMTYLVSFPSAFTPEAKMGLCALLEYSCLTKRRALLRYPLPPAAPIFGTGSLPLIVSALRSLLADETYTVRRRALQAACRLLPHMLHEISNYCGGDVARRSLRRIWYKIETMLDEFGRDSYNHIRNEFTSIPPEVEQALVACSAQWKSSPGPELLKILQHVLAISAEICNRRNSKPTRTAEGEADNEDEENDDDVGMVSAASEILGQFVESLSDPRGVEDASDFAPLLSLDETSRRDLSPIIRKALLEGPVIPEPGGKPPTPTRETLSEGDKSTFEQEMNLDHRFMSELKLHCPTVEWLTTFSPAAEKAERYYPPPAGADQSLFATMAAATGPIPRSRGLSEPEEKLTEEQEEREFEKGRPEFSFTRVVTLRSFPLTTGGPFNAQTAHNVLAVPAAKALVDALSLSDPQEESTDAWSGVQIAEAVLRREAVLTAVSMAVCRAMALRPRTVPYFLPHVIVLCSRLSAAFSDAVLATASAEDEPIRISQRNSVIKLRSILALSLSHMYNLHRRILPYCLLGPLEHALRGLGIEGVGLGGTETQGAVGPGGATGLPAPLTPSAADEVMRNLMKWPPGHIVELALLTAKNKIMAAVKPGPNMTGVGLGPGSRALLKPLPEIALPLSDDVTSTVPGEPPATRSAAMRPQLPPKLHDFVSRFVFDVVTPTTGSAGPGAAASAAAAAALRARADAVNETLYQKVPVLTPSNALNVARSALIRLLSDQQEDAVFAAGGRSLRNSLLARLAAHPLPLGIRASDDDIAETIDILLKEPDSIFDGPKTLLDLPSFPRPWAEAEVEGEKAEDSAMMDSEAEKTEETLTTVADTFSKDVHLPSLVAYLSHVKGAADSKDQESSIEVGTKRRRGYEDNVDNTSSSHEEPDSEAATLAKMLPRYAPLIRGHPHILRPETLEDYITIRPAHRGDLALRWLHVVLESEREMLAEKSVTKGVFGESPATGDYDATELEGAPDINANFTADNAPLPSDIAEHAADDPAQLKKAKEAMVQAQKLRRARVLCRTAAASLDFAYALSQSSMDPYHESGVNAMVSSTDIAMLLRCSGTSFGGFTPEDVSQVAEDGSISDASEVIYKELKLLSLPGEPLPIKPTHAASDDGSSYGSMMGSERSSAYATTTTLKVEGSATKLIKLDPAAAGKQEESAESEAQVMKNEQELAPMDIPQDGIEWAQQPSYIAELFQYSGYKTLPYVPCPFPQYEAVLLRLMAKYIQMAASNPTSAADRLLTQLLLECPLIPHSAFAAVYSFVMTQASATMPMPKAVNRIIIGLNLLRDLALKRPACRRVALLFLLAVATGVNSSFTGPSQAIRAGARTLLVELYASNKEIRQTIGRWMVHHLGELVNPGLASENARDIILARLPPSAAFVGAGGQSALEAITARASAPIKSALDVIQHLRETAERLAQEAQAADVEAKTHLPALQQQADAITSAPGYQPTEAAVTETTSADMTENADLPDPKKEPSLERQTSSSSISIDTPLGRIQTKIKFYTTKAARAAAASEQARSQLLEAERNAEAAAVTGVLELLGALSIRQPNLWRQILALYAVNRPWISRGLTRLGPTWLSQMPFAGARGSGAQGAAVAREVASTFENAPPEAYRFVLYLMDILTGVKPQSGPSAASAENMAETAAAAAAGATDATAYLFSPPQRPLPVSFQVAAWKLYEKNNDDPRFLIPQLPVLTPEMIKEHLPRLLALPKPLPDAIISRLLGMVPQPIKTPDLLRYLHTPQACGGRIGPGGELIADPQAIQAVSNAITQVLKHPTAADAVELSKVVSDLTSVKHLTPLVQRTVEQATALVPALAATIQALRSQPRRRVAAHR